MPDAPTARTRGDLCPGVLRPWPAEDGGLVRLRLIGGALESEQLQALSGVAARYGDGDVHLTARANLQVRGLPLVDGHLAGEVVDALVATGLLPHPTHELVRNVMLSPLSGVNGGVADLRDLARAYDELVCADPILAGLPGRFLTVLDDGRGDLQARTLDLGAMAVSESEVQLRAGSAGWGDVVDLDAAPARLVALAHEFLDRRGAGDAAAWHVDELDQPLLDGSRDVRTLRNAGPLPYGPFDGGVHVEVPDGVLTPTLTDALEGHLVVTPWNGVVVTA
ncbi:nitrite reductase [Nocardioides marmorisolisilvae]|uniref:nitrite reductase n=1 Tax=Nocardioides marmorisolisilvae TaxID=1542737 RepID=UPI00161ADEBD|nr:nitrite reductase [Nocardioides marmorisolisilvae]